MDTDQPDWIDRELSRVAQPETNTQRAKDCPVCALRKGSAETLGTDREENDDERTS